MEMVLTFVDFLVKTTPPPVFDTSTIVTIVTALCTLGGLVFAAVKLRPEADGLAASASKTAVEVFSASVTNLQNDLAEAKAEIILVEAKLAKLQVESQQSMAALRLELEASQAESKILRRQLQRSESYNERHPPE